MDVKRLGFRLVRKIVKTLLKLTFLYAPIVENARRSKERKDWIAAGRPVPPPHIIKQEALRYFGKQFKLRILVETGTYLGDMIHALRKDFGKIYSVEIDRDLHDRARERFKRRRNVELILGDSGRELPGILAKISQPALFWLDGHYSGGITGRGLVDTPVLDELGAILTSAKKGSVVIMDDARCFGTDPAYPSIQAVKDFVKDRSSDFDIEVRDDGIRLFPRTHLGHSPGA
jgi:hypothetical protein